MSDGCASWAGSDSIDLDGVPAPSAGRHLHLRQPGGKDRTGMRAHQRGIIAVATAALLVALASCADDGGNDRAASGSRTPSSPAPTTSSPTPQTESEMATDAASATLRKYYAVRNQLRQHPDRALRLLTSVAISTELAAQRNLFKQERKQGLHQVGRRRSPSSGCSR